VREGGVLLDFALELFIMEQHKEVREQRVGREESVLIRIIGKREEESQCVRFF